MQSSRLAIEGGPPIRTEPFPDWPRATPAARAALLDVLESGHWWQADGGWNERLEQWLASEHGACGAVAVTNGTNALEVAFRALGIGLGDEVLVPALTFISTATAVSLLGATPVPVDVRDDTLCLDASELASRVTEGTRAVAVVHIAGQPVDMPSVCAFATDAGLGVVEDAAQAIGSEWELRRTCTFGDLSTLSFQASKLLSAGEGGAVIVRDETDLLERIRLLVNCGRPRNSQGYAHKVIGSNHRMTEFQAALILSQTDDYGRLAGERDRAAARLTEAILAEGVGEPLVVDPRVTRMSWYVYPLRLPEDLRARVTNVELATALTAEGVPAKQLYPAFYETPAYAAAIDKWPPCPNAERAGREVVVLHHSLLLDGERGVQDVVSALGKVVRHWRARSHSSTTRASATS